MIIRANSAFPYNNESQVKNWVAKLLDLDPKKIEINLVTSIGWNGNEFVSSTDWKVQTSKGVSAFHPAAVPQYETYVSIKGGMNIISDENNKGRWMLDYDNKQTTLTMPDGSVYVFEPGESIEVVWAEDADNILLSDCLVQLVEDDEKRRFIITTDENSVYGGFINGTFWPK